MVCVYFIDYLSKLCHKSFFRVMGNVTGLMPSVGKSKITLASNIFGNNITY